MTSINNRELLNKLIYSYGCCLQNSMKNRNTLFKDFGIKTFIKVGSLGFGLTKDIHYEYGYIDEKEFEKKYNKGNSFDLHFWLEDEQGNIIDCYYYNYNMICEINGVKCLFKQHSLIKQKKEMLKRMGVHYVELKNKKLIKEVSRKVLRSCCRDEKSYNEAVKSCNIFN